MFIYNITIKFEWAIGAAYMKWMQEKHIPDIMNTGYFEKYQFVKLLDIDEEEGPTYALQLYAADRAKYETYIQHHAPALREESKQLWGDRCMTFRTLMEVVN